jgi:CRP/FNR family transcriptional regulator/CRP/FNR family cyclic AMP-dependent transcriptional regulator
MIRVGQSNEQIEELLRECRVWRDRCREPEAASERGLNLIMESPMSDQKTSEYPGSNGSGSSVPTLVSDSTKKELSTLAGEAVSKLAAEGTVRHYRRGTYLCHQGEFAADVFFLIEGRVEASSVAITGSRVYHGTVDTPQFVGELGPLGDMPRTASLLALAECEVWAIPAEEFVRFITREQAAARDVIRALARQLQGQQAFVDDLLFLDLKGRVAKRLLQMVTPDLDDLPADGVVVPEVTQADLASLCGGSRENVTRILKEFDRRGLVRRDGHRYVLKKVAALAKLAEI